MFHLITYKGGGTISNAIIRDEFIQWSSSLIFDFSYQQRHRRYFKHVSG